MVFDNGNKRIKLCDNILSVMKNYIQSDRTDCEAGGILIGRENLGNSNLIIEFLTEPMRADIRARYKYIRKDKKHLHIYQQLYENNGEIYAYVGEWHTHPENNPSYSSVDVINWKKIAKKMNGGIQYHIIVGIQEVCIWEYNTALNSIMKIGSFEWERIEI